MVTWKWLVLNFSFCKNLCQELYRFMNVYRRLSAFTSTDTWVVSFWVSILTSCTQLLQPYPHSLFYILHVYMYLIHPNLVLINYLVLSCPFCCILSHPIDSTDASRGSVLPLLSPCIIQPIPSHSTYPTPTFHFLSKFNSLTWFISYHPSHFATSIEPWEFVINMCSDYGTGSSCFHNTFCIYMYHSQTYWQLSYSSISTKTSSLPIKFECTSLSSITAW